MRYPRALIAFAIGALITFICVAIVNATKGEPAVSAALFGSIITILIITRNEK